MKPPIEKAKKGVVLPLEKTVRAQRPQDIIQMYYGPPGVGKTTFVNNMAERVLFLSTDRGTRQQEALRVECNRWKDFELAINAMTEPSAPRYDIVCIDHVEDWAGMAEEQVCRDFSIEGLGDAGYGKGWKMFRTKLRQQVSKILQLGIGLVFIAHEDLRTIKQKSIETTRTMPSLSKTAWKVVVPLTDIVGYCGFRSKTVVTDKGGKKRVEVRGVMTQPTEDIYAKDRSRRTKPESGWEPLDADKFVATFARNTNRNEDNE